MGLIFKYLKLMMLMKKCGQYSSQAGLVSLCSASLCFTDSAFFKKLKLCGNFALSTSTDTIFFLTVFAHNVSLCHTLVNSSNMSNFIIIIILTVLICDSDL